MDNLFESQFLVENLGLPMPVLYDPEAEVIGRYGVYDLLGDGMATPATFIIDKEGVIRWKHVGSRVSDRPTAQQVLELLEQLGS